MPSCRCPHARRRDASCCCAGRSRRVAGMRKARRRGCWPVACGHGRPTWRRAWAWIANASCARRTTVSRWTCRRNGLPCRLPPPWRPRASLPHRLPLAHGAGRCGARTAPASPRSAGLPLARSISPPGGRRRRSRRRWQDWCCSTMRAGRPPRRPWAPMWRTCAAAWRAALAMHPPCGRCCRCRAAWVTRRWLTAACCCRKDRAGMWRKRARDARCAAPTSPPPWRASISSRKRACAAPMARYG
ncbi:hypothetical protein D3C81_1200200 [compost metagenome]